ncbi:hypothetical protein [Acidovorax sp.]|jgi:hypothetical protein|uniref:hypothetical protein n=1 Tax=Acidovorax sp. TaxID=1872122 RepID=UPI00391FBD33
MPAIADGREHQLVAGFQGGGGGLHFFVAVFVIVVTALCVRLALFGVEAGLALLKGEQAVKSSGGWGHGALGERMRRPRSLGRR